MKTSERFRVQSHAVIILAAGNSSRLGRPKQLLTYAGKPLLQLAIDNAKESKTDKIVVVLGSDKESIESKINKQGITIVENLNWASGISSSIKAGINALKEIYPGVDAIILMVSDQPFADAKILDALLREQAESGNAIVGCSYDNTKGIPALFHKSIFADLSSLEGDAGGKRLFNLYTEVASFVSFKNGGIDIDTSEDYKNLAK